MSSGSVDLGLTYGAMPVTSVSATTPLASSGGLTPNLSIQQSTTAQAGFLSAADWNTFNNKQPAGNYLVLGAVPITSTVYVDVRRTDSYVADGTFELPYKTVMAAVNRIIANGDNSSAKPYSINIAGPCDIVENIVLESLLLTDIFMIGDGPLGSISVTPLSGNALQSTANNSILHLLSLQNMIFNAPVQLIGDTDNSHFLNANGTSINCEFNDTITLQNAQVWTFEGGAIPADVNIQNVFAIFFLRGNGNNGTITGVYNAGANKPSGTTSVNMIFDGCVSTGDIVGGTGVTVQARGGARLGSTGGSITIGDGTMTLYPSFVRANISIGAAGTLIERGGMYKDSTLTLAGGATVTKDVALGQFKSFRSTEQTGTGAVQNIAHGLGYIPNIVIYFPTDTTATIVSGYTVMEGAHTSTNVVLTVTTGLKYKVVAF